MIKQHKNKIQNNNVIEISFALKILESTKIKKITQKIDSSICQPQYRLTFGS